MKGKKKKRADDWLTIYFPWPELKRMWRGHVRTLGTEMGPRIRHLMLLDLQAHGYEIDPDWG